MTQAIAKGESRGAEFLRNMLLLGCVAVLGAPVADRPAWAAGAPSAQAELEALVKAAKSEGELTFYSSHTENVNKRIAEEFSRKYGIRVQHVRPGATIPTLQRYATEAASGSLPASLLIVSGGAVQFATEAIKKGWVESIADASLPVVKSSEFPAAFNRGVTAVIGVMPWMIGYNTEKLKAADAPRDWPDLLNPRLKGQILLPDPRSAAAYLDFWVVALDKYGPEFFAKLRAQNLRLYSAGVPAIQALAAGEGAIIAPAAGAPLESVRAKGAPLASAAIALTSGVEMQLVLTARARARQPAAARLMANYVMSKEGNAVFNADPGVMSVYDSENLPKQYQSPRPETEARAAEIVKMLGL